VRGTSIVRITAALPVSEVEKTSVLDRRTDSDRPGISMVKREDGFACLY